MKKISIISGGSSGLGLEIAGLLVKSGKNVLILGRNKERLSGAVKRLEKSVKGNSAHSLACNIGNEQDITKVCDFLSENNYGVEFLFNNAGRGLFSKAETATASLIDLVFEANLKGMILLTSAVLRITPEKEELTIVNIMSSSALLGRAEETIYCASKFGARGYTEALRTEMKGTNRNIIGVYPGGMKTDFWNVTRKERDISKYMDPEEVADKIVDAVLNTKGLIVSEIMINRKA